MRWLIIQGHIRWMFIMSQFSKHEETLTETHSRETLCGSDARFHRCSSTMNLQTEAFTDLLMSSQSLQIRRCYHHVFLLSYCSHFVKASPHQESFQCLHYGSQGAPVHSLYQQIEERRPCEHLISLCGEKCLYLLTRAAFKTCTASFTLTLHSKRQLPFTADGCRAMQQYSEYEM